MTAFLGHHAHELGTLEATAIADARKLEVIFDRNRARLPEPPDSPAGWTHGQNPSHLRRLARAGRKFAVMRERFFPPLVPAWGGKAFGRARARKPQLREAALTVIVFLVLGGDVRPLLLVLGLAAG